MALNITRNGLGNQRGHALRRGGARAAAPDVGGADGHQGQLQRATAAAASSDLQGQIRLQPSSESARSATQIIAIRTISCQRRQVCSAATWSSPITRKSSAAGIFGLQLPQRVDGVGRAGAPDLPVVDLHPVQAVEGQPAHGQPVFGRAERPALVPGLPGRQRSAAHPAAAARARPRPAPRAPDAADRTRRRTCRCVCALAAASLKPSPAGPGTRCTARSSGDPASGCAGRPSSTSGGMDIRMDSVRPPDCRPKCVPRSQTRLNST